MTKIFWFSGTGNSLWAAQKLGTELGNTSLCPIRTGVPHAAVGGPGEKIGFVFPSYYGNLPRLVRTFTEKLEIKPGTYFFVIVTMGGLGQGSIAEFDWKAGSIARGLPQFKKQHLL